MDDDSLKQLRIREKMDGRSDSLPLNTGARRATIMVKHAELLRLILTGFSLKECSRQMEVGYMTVRRYVNQPCFLDELKKLSAVAYSEIDRELAKNKKTIMERLEELSEKALDRLEELLESNNEAIVQRAIDSALDRHAPTARNKKVESDNKLHIEMNPLTLIHAAATAKEMEEFERQKKQVPEVKKGELPSGGSGQ